MTTKPDLTETLDRKITIGARRETVFRYFTDSARFAKWWGAGSQMRGRGEKPSCGSRLSWRKGGGPWRRVLSAETRRCRRPTGFIRR